MDRIKQKVNSFILVLYVMVVAANPIKDNEEDAPEEKQQSSLSSSSESNGAESPHPLTREEITTDTRSDAVVMACNPNNYDGHNNGGEGTLDASHSVHTHNTHSSKIMHTSSFGSPGPPGLDINDDLDELTLDSTEYDPKSTGTTQHENRTQKEGELLHESMYIRSSRHHLPSMSTLSQDELTLDAEMGRPPTIPPAEVARRRRLEAERQQRERTERKDVEEMRVSNDGEGSEKQLLGETAASTKHGKSAPYKSKIDDSDIMSFIKELAKSTNQPLPTVKLFDAAVFYDKADYENVKSFIEEIRTVVCSELAEEPRIELFDSEEFSQSMVMVVADVVDRCSVVFVYISDNSNTELFRLFCDEAIGLSRLGLNNPGGAPDRATVDRRWVLKPVHTQPSKDRTYKTPIGLLTLHGIEWYDWPKPYVRDKVTAVMKSAMIQRKSRETEKNITMGYQHAVREDHGLYKPNTPPRVGNQGQGQTKSMNSVDALSFLPIQSARPMPPTQTHPSVRGHGHVIPAGQQFQQYEQQQQQHNVYHPQQFVPQHNVQPYPPYNHSQIPAWQQQQQGYRPYQNVGPNYQSYQHVNIPPTVHPIHGYAPPAYQAPALGQQTPPVFMSRPMADDMSNPYLCTNQNMQCGQYNQVPAGYIQIPGMARPGIGSLPRGHIQDTTNIYRTQADYQTPIGRPGQYQTNTSFGRQHSHPHQTNTGVGHPHPGAGYGSLMLDKRHDTPTSDELKVVSRVTGKLITNPDLSNTDLEIDTHEHAIVKHMDGLPTRISKTGDKDGEDGDDSDTDSDDSDTESSLKAMFSKHGKVVNIIGSKVVQIGKNNTASEKSKRKQEGKRQYIPEENIDKVDRNDADVERHVLPSSRGTIVPGDHICGPSFHHGVVEFVEPANNDDSGRESNDHTEATPGRQIGKTMGVIDDMDTCNSIEDNSVQLLADRTPDIQTVSNNVDDKFPSLMMLSRPVVFQISAEYGLTSRSNNEIMKPTLLKFERQPRPGLVELVNGEPELTSNNVSGETEARINNVGGETEARINNVSGETEARINNVGGETEARINNVGGETEARINNVGGETEARINNVSGETVVGIPPDIPPAKFSFSTFRTTMSMSTGVRPPERHTRPGPVQCVNGVLRPGLVQCAPTCKDDDELD